VGDYQDQGIFPAAMRNFLALLGWSPGGDREIMPEDEMIALFSLEGIQSKPAVFDVAKLEWMNGQYLSATPAEELRAPVERQLARQGVSAGARDLLPIIDAVKTRSRTVVQLAEQVAVRLNGPSGELEPKAAAFRQKLGPAFEQNLARAVEALSPIGEGEWNSERILEAIKQSAEQHGTKLGDAMQPIRIALTGGTVSEPVNDLLAVIGRDAALERLKRVVRHTS
jgi:glutamyl-tRNA synthetase